MVQKTHIYGWDDEPIDERPSEFRSAGFSTLSGFHPAMDPGRRNRPQPRFGAKSVVATAMLLVSAASWAMYHLVNWFHV